MKSLWGLLLEGAFISEITVVIVDLDAECGVVVVGVYKYMDLSEFGKQYLN